MNFCTGDLPKCSADLLEYGAGVKVSDHTKHCIRRHIMSPIMIVKIISGDCVQVDHIADYAMMVSVHPECSCLDLFREPESWFVLVSLAFGDYDRTF